MAQQQRRDSNALKPLLADAEGDDVPVQPPKDEKKPSQHERLTSLDCFRGLTIAWMIAADNLGNVYGGVLDHSPWHNITFADFVFPFFVFISGVSVPLSMSKFKGTSAARRDALVKAFIRALKLFGLGLLVQGGTFLCDYNLEYLRIPGILQRIAFCYFVVAIMELYLPTISNDESTGYFRLYVRYAVHWTVFALILGVYLVLTFAVDVPGCGRGHLDPTCNSSGYLDRKLLGVDHLYTSPTYSRTPECSSCSPAFCPRADAPAYCTLPYDPEGATSSVMACGSAFLGLFCGYILLNIKDPKERLLQLVPLSVVCLVIGLIVHFTGFPMNKNLWSTSFTFFMAAIAGFFLSFFYLIVDVWGYETPFAPLRCMGLNAIFVFMMGAADVFESLVGAIHYGDPSNTVFRWLKKDCQPDGAGGVQTGWLERWFGCNWGGIIYALCKIGLWLIVSVVLHRRRIYFKV